jgi:hypothetical protein
MAPGQIFRSMVVDDRTNRRQTEGADDWPDAKDEQLIGRRQSIDSQPCYDDATISAQSGSEDWSL